MPENHKENKQGFILSDKIEDFKIDLDWIYFVSLLDRPGAKLFNTQLEFENFPPDKSLNNLFVFGLVKWENQTWVVSGIPVEYRTIAEQVAKDAGLRIADGVPTLAMDGKLVSQFPLNKSNVYTLENTPESGIYRYNKELMAAAKAQNREKVAVIIAEEQKMLEKLWAEEDEKVQAIIAAYEKRTGIDTEKEMKKLHL